MILHPTYLFWVSKLKKLREKLGRPLRVLDYGCGNGVLIGLLGTNYFAKYYGVDTSSDSISVGKSRYKNYKNINFRVIYPDQMPSFEDKGKLDLVILVGVFQYLNDREIDHVINESIMSLKPGGKLMFSTVLDTPIYRYLNAYQLVFPNRYINRNKLTKKLSASGFKIETNIARGLIIGPLVSHALVIPFDAVDHFILGVRGKIGYLGMAIRMIMFPLMYLEILIPIDYGYTWYVVASKK